jgi:hypothetical protein
MSAFKEGPPVSAESGKMVPVIKEGQRVSEEAGKTVPDEPGKIVPDEPGKTVPEESGKTVPDKPAHRVNPGSLDPIEQSDVSEDDLVIIFFN